MPTPTPPPPPPPVRYADPRPAPAVRAEIRCLDPAGAVETLVIVGEDGIEQIRGKVAAFAELLRLLLADPIAQALTAGQR